MPKGAKRFHTSVCWVDAEYSTILYSAQTLTLSFGASSAGKLSGARKFPYTPARLLCLSKHLCVLSIGERTTFHAKRKDLDMDKILPITPLLG